MTIQEIRYPKLNGRVDNPKSNADTIKYLMQAASDDLLVK